MSGRAHPVPPATLPPLQTLERLGHLTVVLRAELDRTTMAFADVARLTSGSVIALPSSAGDTIGLFIGDVQIGSGEVLVVDGILTVRVSDLASAAIAGEAEKAGPDAPSTALERR
jgi:flagellar motor switch/type III secretory pathway protein FliN